MLVLSSCDKTAPASSAGQGPEPPISWSLDLAIGPGLSAITRDTSVRGFLPSSTMIHGRIRGFSREVFRDSLAVGSIRGSAQCALSDSGDFSVQAGRVLVMNGQTRLSISPVARPGFVLSPDGISIIVYNF